MKAALTMLAACCAANMVHAQIPLSVDTTFRTTIRGRNVINMLFLDNGQMIIVGLLSFQSNPIFWYGGVKLNADGTRDPSFWIGPECSIIVPWNDQYYIQCGQYFRRFNGDGTVDWDWQYTNLFINSIFGGGLHVFPDGSVLTTGLMELYSYADTTSLGDRYCLVKIDPNGFPDSTFTHRQCQLGYVWGIDALPDGKFLLSGSQSIYDGQSVGNILKVWPDGSIDTTFHTDIFYGGASDYYHYPDGRILAAGIFMVPEYPGDTLHLLRLLPDGAVDTTFNNTVDIRTPDEYFPSARSAADILELETGLLLVTGEFTHVEGEEVGGIVALDTAGQVLHDLYFTGTGCGKVRVGGFQDSARSINRIERGPDGSLYLLGSFTGFDDGHGFIPDLPFMVKLHALDVGVGESLTRSIPVKVFPNPGTDVLHIEADTNGKVDVHMLDGTGRSVLNASSFTGSLELGSSSIAPGVYMVEVHTAQGRQTLKWIKR